MPTKTKTNNANPDLDEVADDLVAEAIKDVPKAPTSIRLERLEQQVIVVPIIGVTPLIPGKWSEKAKAQMRESQTSTTKIRQKKEPKIPEQEAEGRTYRLDDGRPGVPAVNFKCALVDGVRFFDGLKMTDARRSFFVFGEGPELLVPIEGEPHLREDMVRNATGVADIRYRYAFWPWSAELRIGFITKIVDGESILHLVDAAGRCGVCEWRPSSPRSASGIFGTFEVDFSKPARLER